MAVLHRGEPVLQRGEAAKAGVHLCAERSHLVAEFIDGVLGEAQGFFEPLDAAVAWLRRDVVGRT